MKRLTLLLVLLSSVAFAQNQQRVGSQPNNHLFRTGGLQVFEAPDSAYIYHLIQNELLGGCVAISNMHFTGLPHAYGLMIDSSNSIGLTKGVVLTSGMANLLVGPNNAWDAGSDNYTLGDPDLDLLATEQTYDAAVIEFDFVPFGDTIYIADFVFGSEEYPEWVNSMFNDVFAFYISGPSTNGPINTALIPNTNIPVAINNLNNGYVQNGPTTGPCLHCQYYVDNDSGLVLQYDGYTTPLHLQHPVVAGETYHFKVAIADAGDGIYDSGVIIESQSFCTPASFLRVEFNPLAQESMTYSFVNSSERANDYFWDFGDGTYSSEANPIHTYTTPGTYEVVLRGSNHCLDELYSQTLEVSTIDNIDAVNNIREFEIYTNSLGNYTLKYAADKAEKVSLRISDIQGRIISMQDFGTVRTVKQDIDLSHLSQGIYIAQLVVGNQVQAKRLVR